MVWNELDENIIPALGVTGGAQPYCISVVVLTRFSETGSEIDFGS